MTSSKLPGSLVFDVFKLGVYLKGEGVGVGWLVRGCGLHSSFIYNLDR